MTDPAVACTIDLTAPGKQVGRLQYPKITNTGGWAFSFVPIATIVPFVIFYNRNDISDRSGGPVAVIYGQNIPQTQAERLSRKADLCR